MRSSIPTRKSDLEDIDVVGVAIPFKWGQVFQQIYLNINVLYEIKSQSLLNEVKYSNEPSLTALSIFKI